jgi:hypothetical protein
VLRVDLKKPIAYTIEHNLMLDLYCKYDYIEVDVKTPRLFSMLENNMLLVKYKDTIYNITSVEFPRTETGYIFINGNLAITFRPNYIKISKAVVGYSKNYSTFVNYFLKNLLKYKYSYGEPDIVEVDTLKDYAVLINVPTAWEKTKRLKTRRLQPTTTSNSVQS